MPNGQQQPETIDRPYLVVPYGTDDDGSRPLKIKGAVYYECPSILIDQQPYDPKNPIKPDDPVNLSVMVKNRGALSCLVTARFYCTSPATAWLPRPIGSTTFYMRAGGPDGPAMESFPPVRDFVPSDYFTKWGLPTPEHFCFFVEVTTPLDMASGNHNAVYDRHCGQQNVERYTVGPGQRLTIPFEVAGRGHERYVVSVGPAGDSDGALSFPNGALRIVDRDQDVEAVTALEVALQTTEVRRLEAVIDMPEKASAGDMAQLVIEQTAIGSVEEGPVGAIGVTVVVDG